MARNAFNLIVSAVAAVATFAFTGNPALAAAVFSIGNVALSLINPSTPSSDLDDIRASKSAYGEFIHIAYNTVRLGGHLVWASTVRAKERGHGGYEYGQDCRWVICESPRTVHGDAPAFVTVKRIWLNKQLVFTIDENDELSNIIDIISTSVTIPIYGEGGLLGSVIGTVTKRITGVQTSTSSLQVIRLWYGEPTQMPWDVQVAALGIDNTPAYRGVISISIANIPLHLYGNAIPQIEVEVDVRTIGATPDYITYDPIWPEGVPIVEHTTNEGYRSMVSLFASPSYHPDTMIMQVLDNEAEAGSPPAIGRRSVSTGEWEKDATGADKIALIDYGDGAGEFVWDTFIAPVVWPPTSNYLYTVKYKSTFTDTLDDFQWVELESDYPFDFSKRSPTPLDKGRSDYWGRLHSCSYNSAASMLVGQHDGSGISPNIHTKWSLWAPGANAIGFFKSTDAGFSSRYGDGTTGSGTIPQGFIIDKNDHLWIFTHATVNQSVQLHLDEYSWSVVGTDVTLTFLNRYELINQDGGFNTWSYNIYGATYNETDDTIVLYWTCSLPSETNTNRDPVAINYGGSVNTPTQYRITHFDLATRTKKLSDSDSILITKASDGLLLTDFGNTSEEPYFSGIPGFLGADTNEDGDRYVGTWTEQSWTAMACGNQVSGRGWAAIHDGFFKIDISTGVATKYALWTADLLPTDYESGPDPPGTEGVYNWAGVVYEPTTFCFWSGRRNQGLAGYYTDESQAVFTNTTEGFGRYFINPGSVPQPWNLQQINEDISDRTGVLDVDLDTEYSALADIIPKGFDIDERRPARDSIDQLRTAYLYDIVDEDHLLKAKLRERTGEFYGRLEDAEATIDESEICVVEGKRHFVFQDNNEQELPRWLDLKYYDINAYHQIGTEPARIGGGSPNDRNAVTLNVAVVMDSDEAATAAHRILRSTHAEKKPVAFALSQKYLRLGPADVVVLTRGTNNFEVKITEGFIGANWALPFTSVSHDSGAYSLTAKGKVTDPLFVPSRFAGSSGASGSGGTGSGPAITIVPEPRMVVVDTGLVDEIDDTVGHFVTIFPLLHKNDGGKWSGADAEQGASSTGSFANKGRIEQGPVAGETTEVLADYEGWASWDRDSVLKVQITNGKPTSVTETRLWMEPNLNLFLVGSELLQAATIIDRGNGVFWFTDLLRGRHGTEWATGTHAVGEAIVAYDKTQFLSVTYNSSQIDVTRYWRARNEWQGVYSEVVTADQATRRLWPLAPYFIRGNYDSGDNLTITFLQRQRVRGQPLESPPEFEAEEDFECDIMTASGGVVRTITTTASAGGSVVTTGDNRNVYYSAADQISDWGAVQPSYDVEIYKMNAVVGRGYPGRASV